MTEMPLVSVIMPAFNAAATIGDSIQSALDQTYRPVEVLVIDDGSTDGTPDLVRARFGETVRLFAQPHLGRGAARNRGLEEARGHYIQFLDSDDLIAPDKFESQVAWLESHPSDSVAYGPVECFLDGDPTTRWPLRAEPGPSGDILARMVDDGIVLPVAALVRSSILDVVGGFALDLHGTEDWDLFLRLGEAGSRFAYTPDHFVGSYRVRPDNGPELADTNHTWMGVLALMRLQQRLDPARRKTTRVRRAIGRWRFGYGRALLLQGHRLKGAGQMLRGCLADRRSLAYKLAWVVIGTTAGGDRARSWIAAMQRRAGRGRR